MVVKEIDNFYSYKKSICKECVNRKVKCDYCDKEFKNTNLSKHIKQTHSTYNSSRTNDSTYNSSRTKRQFANNLKKLKELNYFNEKICNKLLKSIH